MRNIIEGFGYSAHRRCRRLNSTGLWTPMLEARAGSEKAAQAAFSDAISMTKRYFTSLFTMRA